VITRLLIIFFRGWGDEGRWSVSDHRPEGAKGGGWTGIVAAKRVAVGTIAAGIWRIGMVLARADYDRPTTALLRFLV
jgi:hypothetical protein